MAGRSSFGLKSSGLKGAKLCNFILSFQGTIMSPASEPQLWHGLWGRADPLPTPYSFPSWLYDPEQVSHCLSGPMALLCPADCGPGGYREPLTCRSWEGQRPPSQNPIPSRDEKRCWLTKMHIISGTPSSPLSPISTLRPQDSNIFPATAFYRWGNWGQRG